MFRSSAGGIAGGQPASCVSRPSVIIGATKCRYLPDIPLWALWAIQQYAKWTGADAARKLYLPAVTQLVDYVRDGRHPNLYVDPETGLLSTDGHDKAVS